ncbi:BLUF domain-containing protein [Erythrobacter crassostreae]|uniref:BLUF domain-containing protein n=1 Tax=Erythrobacter crassostreae TaxID=2828328 RepID=A0A9X1F3J2_9SPHN|nr:BLUF domain-containing protein [Erythrobacter crassostrea]MBV7259499.1 BLUF domain-containing protein [Erythrobacter crassostrea]
MSLEFQAAETDPTNWIGSLAYRSKATADLSATELQGLTSNARLRNRKCGVTGMLIHQDGQFFQKLEGPPASLKHIWASISQDPRHDDIEMLSEHIVPARLFSDWDLLVYNSANASPAFGGELAENSGLFSKVPKLVDLALGGDDIGTNTLIASLAEKGWNGDAILAQLIEPTARALGDAWLADDCTELDLTMGLSMLQLAGHAVRHRPTPEAIRETKYSILLATAPGEPHMLGTSMLADLFTDAGWHVDMAFPGSDEALANQLGAQQPDALDIGMSEALSREHTLATLRETIQQSREASPDHLTVVSVGGRMFAEAAATAASVGADHARDSVVGTTVRIAELIRQKRQIRP